MKKIIYAMSAAALLLSSCGDFLEEESQSEVIPKTASDFSELLLGSGYPDNAAPDFSWIEYLSDDCQGYVDLTTNVYDENWNFLGTQDAFAEENQTITPLPYYAWQPNMMDQDGYGNQINQQASSTTYGQYYTKIMGCNAVLDGIDDATGSQEMKDRVKAEALAVRALLYFQLVNIYGEPYNSNKEALGVPMKLNANLSKEGIARATVGQIYEQVLVPDLQEAARLMDPLPIEKANYRVTQPAIHILLSRVYLYMDRYQDCIDEANKALKQGIRLMNLNTELDKSKVVSGEFNPLDYSNPEVLWVFGPGTRYSSDSYRPTMSQDFQSLYDQANDLRWVQFGLGNPQNVNPIQKPYGNSSLCQNIRTAEAYLNKMEAEALLGQTAQANADLNTFCGTRYANYANQNLSGDALLTTIRNERRREFCYEGHRWFDLRREGMPEISHIYRERKGGPLVKYVLLHNDPMYTIPLPTSAFDNNNALQQNECRYGSMRTVVPAE